MLRLLRRWRPAFPSWREISDQFQNCLTNHRVEGWYWPLDDPVRAAAEVMGLIGSEPKRLQAARSASEQFHRDFDADKVASRLFHFVMGITPSARSDQAAPETSLLVIFPCWDNPAHPMKFRPTCTTCQNETQLKLEPPHTPGARASLDESGGRQTSAHEMESGPPGHYGPGRVSIRTPRSGRSPLVNENPT